MAYAAGGMEAKVKISIEEISVDHEEEIIIRCHQINQEILEVCQKLGKHRNYIPASFDKEIYRIFLNDIFYFETVDNKSFLYCMDRVYEAKLKLYEFEELCVGTAFFRASKSVILNADRIRCVKPALSGRFEATLENGEKVIVSRQYVAQLKKALGMKV